MSKIFVAALYHFTSFEDRQALQGPLQDVCDSGGVKGSLLLAFEGINGTIAGPREGIDAALAHIRALPGCADFDHKESVAEILKMKLPTSVIIFYTKLHFFLSSYRRLRVAYNSHHVLQELHRR